MKISKLLTTLGVAALLVLGQTAAASTAITYQGQLRQAGTPFTGTANLEFRLFTQLSGGSQVGPTQTRNNWLVEDGLLGLCGPS